MEKIDRDWAIHALKKALVALNTCEAGDYDSPHVSHPSFNEDAVFSAAEAVAAALTKLKLYPEPEKQTPSVEGAATVQSTYEETERQSGETLPNFSLPNALESNICAQCDGSGEVMATDGTGPYSCWACRESRWDASRIKQPGWNHVEGAFIEGARQARANPEAGDFIFRRAADAYTKQVFEAVDPESEWRLRTGDFTSAFNVSEQPAKSKSLNAMAADLLRPYLKPGQKVIWREAFRWHDDNGVLSNHYDSMSAEQLAADFGYELDFEMNFKHAAIVAKVNEPGKT